jgi:hypothetical protein
MLPIDADPLLLEAQEIAVEARRVRKALLRDAARIGSAGGKPRRLAIPSTAREIEQAASALPEPLHTMMHDLAALTMRGERLLADPNHYEAIDRALTDRARVLRIAARAQQETRHAEQQRARASGIVGNAAASGRSLTAAERSRVEALHEATTADPATEPPATGWQHNITSAHTRDGVLSALGKIQLREARGQLRSGLLLTRQMRDITAEALPALRRGDPLLLIGETGGAKTALAEFLAHEVSGLGPELVSGYGDVTSAQLIGAHELRAEGGATVSVFAPGPLLRAMSEGRPLILDEVNAMPPEFLKRLNRILQLRPGDTLSVQEDVGREVRIAHGFAILATANEQTPHRYRGLDRLSAELINRYGANSYRVHYPDSGNDFTDFPSENALLATASVVDCDGDLPPGISVDQITRIARAAFISQQVFAGTHDEGFAAFVSTEREIDGRPGLEESVLAPRTLVAILGKVAGSGGTVSLEQALSRFVAGVMHREDRRVLALILQGQGFHVG